MPLYFIKQLGHQEMGSRDTKNSTPKRGRYILVGKKYLDIFPHLSEKNLNDIAIICLKPLFGNKRKVYSSFIYHNSKYANDQNNGRDEYRIYVGKELDNFEFFDDDLIIMRLDKASLSSQEQSNYEYYIYWCPKQDSNNEVAIEIKNYLNSIHAAPNERMFITDDNVFFKSFEKHVERYNNNFEQTKIILDDKTRDQIDLINNENQNNNQENSYAKFFNSTSFRDFVLETYDYRCAVTNTAITYKTLCNIDAAHIIPRASSGTYYPSNGLALRKDIHWAFDMGMFTILAPGTNNNNSLDYIVKVHPDLPSCYLFNFDNHPLFFKKQDNSVFLPDKRSLQFHNDKIFGSFLNRGI